MDISLVHTQCSNAGAQPIPKQSLRRHVGEHQIVCSDCLSVTHHLDATTMRTAQILSRAFVRMYAPM